MFFAVMIILFGGAVIHAAEEPQKKTESLRFGELVDVKGNGLERLKKAIDRKYDDGRVVPTYEIAIDTYEEVELARVLLNETVLAQAQKLPHQDADILLQSHLGWLKYFADNPSRPSGFEQGSGRAIYGALIDLRRIRARLEAARLPWGQYKVYGRIANFCRIPINDELYRLKYGEVKRVLDAPWAYNQEDAKNFGAKINDYPVVLLGDTCRMVQIGAAVYYCAVIVIGGCESDDVHYLCIWSSNGMPQAIYQLKPDKDKGEGPFKIGVVIEGDKVSVTGLNAKAPSFRIPGRNNRKIKIGE
ncbi:MAG: hypothetical protein J5806_10775 [Lentisphaeria bacterium]|nr:hypothetical protein [Lentisphaeria bacterium]